MTLSKAQVSRIETQGSAAPHFLEYGAFLRAEQIKRQKAERKRQEAEANAAFAGLLEVSPARVEELATAAIADQFGSVASRGGQGHVER